MAYDCRGRRRRRRRRHATFGRNEYGVRGSRASADSVGAVVILPYP